MVAADEASAENQQVKSAPAEASPQKASMESSYSAVINQATADGRIVIGGDIEIFPFKSLPSLTHPGGIAVEAKDRRLSKEAYALLCGRSSVPRITMIGSYKNIKNPHIVRLIDAGIVNWTPENRQRFAFVFERPVGKKVLETPDSKPFKISEDRLISAAIQPMISLLSDFKNVDMIHGAVNAENLFMMGSEGGETLMVGECLSCAPSFRQPALYETIPRAMAQAAGRGPGTIKDDLYAFGMCVAMMARGENLLLGKTDDEIIAEKIEHGSYSAIIGRERMPGGVSEFLRGVLNDDEAQRWDVDDVMRWLDGRRLSPKQSRVVLRAARPLLLHEKKYWDLRLLAHDFAKNPTEAATEIDKDTFELWLKRNFEDKGLKNRLDRVWDKEKASPRDRVVSCVCMALDPYAPMRYRQLSVFPQGFGTLLAEAMAKGEDLQSHGDVITQQLFSIWINQIFDEIPDAAGILGGFEKSRNALAQRMAGYGLERVLYMLNKEAACMSPALRPYFILSPGGILRALEDIAKKGGRPETILDRHMIAFLSVRESKMIDPHLGHVISSDKSAQLIGITRTLAAIQRRFSVGPVPSMCNWLISMTGPIVEKVNDRDLQQSLAKAIQRLTDNGNLHALLDMIDDTELMQDDRHRFKMAQQEFRMLGLEKERIVTGLKKRRGFGRATGRQVAMIFSTFLSVIVILGYLILHFLKGF